MSKPKPAWKSGLKAGICLVLLLWILHLIFVREVAEQQGEAWSHLTRFHQWHMAWSVGPAVLWHTLLQIPPLNFAWGLFWMGITLLLGIFRWRIVLSALGLDLSLTRASGISFVAHFFNSFLLGSTGGDLMKAYYVARETHHKKIEAVVAVFVDRLIGLWSMLAFAAVMLLFNFKWAFASYTSSIPTVCVLAMFLVATIFLSLALWGKLVLPAAFWGWLERSRRAELVRRSMQACHDLGRHKSFLIHSLWLSIALNVACVLQFMTLAAGLHLSIPPMVLFFIVPAIICISALPISPNGLGVRENLYVGMLGVIGVLPAPAFSLSILAYAGSLFWSLVGGIVYLFLKDRQHLDQL